MLEYKKVDHNFLNDAPIKIELTTRLNISAEQLFTMFEDPDAWGWATIKTVTWETPKPFGEGTTRTVHVQGQGDIQEYFFAYEFGQHMAFRFERGEMKLVNALVEDYRVTVISDTECQFDWTIGIELRGLLRFLTPLVRGAMKKQFAGMLDTLTTQINGT